MLFRGKTSDVLPDRQCGAQKANSPSNQRTKASYFETDYIGLKFNVKRFVGTKT
jgi:hypothetical protein